MKQYKVLEDYVENEQLNIEQVIKDYSGYVYTAIINIAGNLSEEDIEEILSDVFFIFWKKKDTLKKDDKISFYLVGIAKNLIKEKYRKQKDNLNIEDFENNISINDDIYEYYEEKCRIEQIQKIVNNLDDIDKAIFRLFYYNNQKSKEISRKLKMNEITIRSRLHRIRKQIKENIDF